MALKKFQVRMLTEEQYLDATLARRGRWHTILAKDKDDAASKMIAKHLSDKMEKKKRKR